MGGGPARLYPKANTTAQWWEGKFDRGTFSGIEKILLHTTETTSWPGYKDGASAPTLTYHPRQRAWRQHNYINTSARALVDPSGTAVRENRDNVIQIEIIAYSDERIAESVGGLKVSQLKDEHYRDLAHFVAWVRSEYGGPALKAPRFLPYPSSYGNSAVRMTGPEYDAYRGVLGHQHASGNDHGDPSDIDAQKILRFVQELEGTAPATTPTVPEEDDMPLTIDDAQTVWTARKWGEYVDENGNGVRDARTPIDILFSTHKAALLAANPNVDALAKAVVAKLPPATATLDAEAVKTAIREVLVESVTVTGTLSVEPK